MKKIYLNLLLIISFLFVLSSCTTRYKFTTKGLNETDSSYLVTKEGKHISANDIAVRPSGVKVDNKYYPMGDIVAVKSKKMYFVMDGGTIYLTEIYGKINLLYTLSYNHTNGTGSFAGAGMGMNGGTPSSTTVSKNYYLQKQGSNNVDRLTRATFLEYVGDNEEALSMAKAHYIWNYTTYASFAGFGVGAILLVKSVAADNGSGNYKGPLLLIGGSAVAHVVLGSIANHKLKGAILTYNNSN